MKKSTLALVYILLIVIVPISGMSQVKQVLYVNQYGVDPGDDGSIPSYDPIIRMLDSDENFEVTYVETPQNGSSIPNLSGFDLIIVQENMSSGAELLKPDGVLGIKNVTVPIIYNKTSAFRNTRAVTDVDAVAVSTQNLFITVPEKNQNHDLFKGIDFSKGDQVRITYQLSNSSGSELGDKAIDIVNNLDISTTGTLLASVPQVTDSNKSLVVNYLPSGTKLGENTTDVLGVDVIALSFCYGPLVFKNGINISNEALTIWRNAAYILTGLTVPDGLYYNPALLKKILYVNQTGFNTGLGGAIPGYDPVLRMLQFEDYFDVTYVETLQDGSGIPNLDEFDLVIAQETIDSTADLFKPGGILGIKDVIIPIIYNKTSAFTDGRAVTDTDVMVLGTQNLSITVDPSNQSHELFNGIDFLGGNNVEIFTTSAANDGSDIGDKAIDVLNNLNISANGTLLASVSEVTNANQALVVNYFPAGTQLGIVTTDVLNVDAIALSFSYGAIAKQNGANITNEGLTIWRNAAYMLTGLPVPTVLTTNPAFLKQVLYLNQRGVDKAGNSSSPGNDPVIRMLESDVNFKVTYIETFSDGEQIPDPQLYDLVIAQETLSSGADFFKPGGAIAVKDIKTPIIYNKTAAFRDGRAITDSDAVFTNTQNIFITVPEENQSHALFSGIDFSEGNQVRINKELSNNNGSDIGDQAIDILNNLDISTTGSLLATVPEVTNPDKGLVVNYFKEGTQIGESSIDILNVDAVSLSFSYGAMVKGDGENISSEALTIWRNAAYILTGITVPTELYINPNYTLGINEKSLTLTSNIVLSPNPTSDIVNLKISGANENTLLSLYSLTGQKLWSNEVVIGNDMELLINLNLFSKGIYILRVDRDLISKSFKIYKQ